jgi:hypothetical protein
MASAKRRRLGIGLLVAIAAGALSFGLEGAGKQARSETGTAPSEAAQPATRKTRPIPEAGPLAPPKSLDQVGLPAELSHPAIPPDNPQMREKIALGQNSFERARYRASRGPCYRSPPVAVPLWPKLRMPYHRTS